MAAVFVSCFYGGIWLFLPKVLYQNCGSPGVDITRQNFPCRVKNLSLKYKTSYFFKKKYIRVSLK